MIFTPYRNRTEFESLALPFLSQNEAENNLALGILSRTSEQLPPESDMLMALVHGQDQASKATLEAVIIRTPPFPALVIPGPNPGNHELVELVCQQLLELYGPEMAGFNGNQETMKPFVRRWEQLSGQQAQGQMETRIFYCSSVQHPAKVHGTLRWLKNEHRALFIGLMAEFQQAVEPLQYDPVRVEKLVDRILAHDQGLSGAAVWEVDGEACSTAVYSGKTPQGVRITSVYSPPIHRGKGYASILTAQLTQWLLDHRNDYCFLYTDRANPTSNKIYQSIGYRPVADHCSWSFTAP